MPDLTPRLGRYVGTVFGGETVRAYLPVPLPPNPPVMVEPLVNRLMRAQAAVGRLDGAGAIRPDPSLFLYMYVRKEALLSAQIEGTQSSLSDLLLFEEAEQPGVAIDDVEEVSCYVAAMRHGLDRLRGGMPLSLRLIREIHAELLASGRGATKQPGEFRASQNWIGGSRPGNALFVPPPPHEVMRCMGDLESFIHGDTPTIPLLMKAGMVHVQFETIHPFLDGNGRLGRLLITFMLCAEGLLNEPLLYLSLYLKAHRQEYYDHLQRVREHGDWEAWLGFFLDGVAETAEGAADSARRIMALFKADRERIEASGRATGTAVRLHELFKERPLLTVASAARRLDVSAPTVETALGRLASLGIVGETTGRRRNRRFAYTDYMAILSEGTEPLPP